VPAVAVIQEELALAVVIGFKGLQMVDSC